jgi:hypothetical protein
VNPRPLGFKSALLPTEPFRSADSKMKLAHQKSFFFLFLTTKPFFKKFHSLMKNAISRTCDQFLRAQTALLQNLLSIKNPLGYYQLHQVDPKDAGNHNFCSLAFSFKVYKTLSEIFFISNPKL